MLMSSFNNLFNRVENIHEMADSFKTTVKGAASGEGGLNQMLKAYRSEKTGKPVGAISRVKNLIVLRALYDKDYIDDEQFQALAKKATSSNYISNSLKEINPRAHRKLFGSAQESNDIINHIKLNAKNMLNFGLTNLQGKDYVETLEQDVPEDADAKALEDEVADEVVSLARGLTSKDVEGTILDFDDVDVILQGLDNKDEITRTLVGILNGAGYTAEATPAGFNVEAPIGSFGAEVKVQDLMTGLILQHFPGVPEMYIDVKLNSTVEDAENFNTKRDPIEDAEGKAECTTCDGTGDVMTMVDGEMEYDTCPTCTGFQKAAPSEDGEQEHPFKCGCGEEWQTEEGRDSCPECNGAHDSEDAEEGSIKAQVLAKIEADAGGKFASAADMAKSAENLYNVYGADGDQERAEIALNFDPVQIILQKYPEGVEALKNDGEFDEGLFDELFDHYSNNGEMPYGTAKGRDGDPEEWIFQKLADLGLIDPTEYVEPREDAEVELDDTFKKLFRKAAQLYNRFNLKTNGGDVTIDEINEFITDRELKRHPAFQKQTAKQYPTFTHPQTNEVFNLRSIVNAIKTQAYQTRWEDRAEKEEAEELTLESVYDDMGFIKAPVMDENGITAPTCSTQQYLTEATEQLIEDKENYTTAYLTEQKESDSYKTAPKEKSLSFKERFQPKTQWQLEELRRYGL
jgi:hypothetical protein